jgi:hypothetical protein
MLLREQRQAMSNRLITETEEVKVITKIMEEDRGRQVLAHATIESVNAYQSSPR